MRELEGHRAESQSFLTILQATLRKPQGDLTDADRIRENAERLSRLAENRIIDPQEQLDMVMSENDVLKGGASDSEGDDKPAKDSLAQRHDQDLKSGFMNILHLI
jgi:hypothetical protein